MDAALAIRGMRIGSQRKELIDVVRKGDISFKLTSIRHSKNKVVVWLIGGHYSCTMLGT